MNNKPKVSIIITTFNRDYVIIRTIKNVLSQTYSNLEIIIVDDCSTDNTEKIIKQFIDENNLKIKYIRNVQNLEISNSRNVGIKNANGDFITFIDDDDLILPDKIEKQIKSLIGTKKKICYCGDIWLEDDKILKHGLQCSKNVSFEQGSGVFGLFHKTIFEEIGGYDTYFKRSAEDTDFLIRVNKKYEAVYLEECYYIHFYYNNHKTSDSKKSIEGFEKLLKKHKDILNKYEFSSLYLKLALYNLFDNNKKVPLVLKSIINSISIKNMALLFIFLFPKKISKYIVNKLLDFMKYPVSFNGRYNKEIK